MAKTATFPDFTLLCREGCLPCFGLVPIEVEEGCLLQFWRGYFGLC